MWGDFDWEPGLRVDLKIWRGENGEAGVSQSGLADHLGCTPRALEGLLPDPVDHARVGRMDRTFPIYSANLAELLAHHPRVLESIERRANSMTPKRRQGILAMLSMFLQWDQADLVGLVVSWHRSVRRVGIELGSMTVLIGPNGAGKTSILEAIAGPRSDAGHRFRPGLSAYPVGSRADHAFELPRPDPEMLQSCFGALLRGIDQLAGSLLRQALALLLARPLVVIIQVEGRSQRGHLSFREGLQSDLLPLAAELGSLALSDPWFGELVSGLQSAERFPLLAEFPMRDPDGNFTTVPLPRSEIVDADPIALVSDFENRMPRLADDIWPVTEVLPPLEVEGVGRDATDAPWVRWVSCPDDLDADGVLDRWRHDDPSIGVGVPSGWARWVAYGAGDVVADSVLSLLPVGERPGPDLLIDFWNRFESLRSSSTADPAEWERVSSFLTWGIPETRDYFDPSSDPYLDSYGGGWLWTELWATEVPATLLALSVMVERRANAIAPRFVRDFGWIALRVLPPDAWEGEGAKLVAEMITRDGQRRRLAECGRGIQRWSAASLREALRQLELSSIDSGSVPEDGSATVASILAATKIGEIGLRNSLLLVDEPETALHIAAQEDVANWLREVSAGGQRVIVSTHSPVFLDQPTSEMEVWSATLGTETVVDRFESSTLERLDELAGLVGLGRSGLLHLARGFLVVEGPTDRMVLERLLSRELRRHRIITLPLHGHTKVLALVQAEFIAAVGRPIAVMFDSVRQEVLSGVRPPESAEERNILKLREFDPSDDRLEAIPFDPPDILCALPDAAVRRRVPGFRGWESVVRDWEASDGLLSFKYFALDELNWPRQGAFQFVAEILESVTDRDEPTRWFAATTRHLLAWAGSIGDRPLGP